MMGAACAGMGMLPGFVAGYLVAFLVKYIEKKMPAGFPEPSRWLLES